VYLRWTGVADADLAHYLIQRAPNAGGSPGTYATIATARTTFFIDDSITPGSSYWYRINATDTSGNASGWVQIAGLVTPRLVTGTDADLELLDWNHSLAFSATDYNTVAWAAGTITLGDDSTTYNISAGNTGDMAAATYVFLDTDVSVTVLQTTTTASAAVGTNRLLVAVAKPTVSGKDAEFYVMAGYGNGVYITADQIAANTITANEIAANTITATEIAAATITGNEIAAHTIAAGNIAADTITAAEIAADTITANEIAADTITAGQIAASTITATELGISTLSAITANMGTLTAGEIRVGTGTPGVDFTGFRIFSSYIGGYNADVLQVGIRSSDGALVAGGGNLILNADGITLVQGTGTPNRINWLYGTRTVGRLYTYISGNEGTIILAAANAVSGLGNGNLRLEAWKDGSNYLAVHLFSGGDIEIGGVSVAPRVLINETENTFMTVGLTINQGASDNEILAFKSSDVGHGMTTDTETDTYFTITKAEGAAGGAMLRGYKSAAGVAGVAIQLSGSLGETADTTKTTAGRGIAEIYAAIQSGTTIGQPGVDANLLSIRAPGVGSKFLFDVEGSAHADVAWTTFAEHDDLALLERLERTAVAGEFGIWAEENRMELERLNIAHFDDRPGHAMINFTRLSMLLTGALRQAGARLAALEARI